MKTVFEPFRIKSVEPIRLSTPSEREVWIREAGYNPFRLHADQVQIDLLTDSGTGAMSTEQWAGIMRGDESYAGARSFFRFESAVKGIFGHAHVIPTHQGRAAEKLLCQACLGPDSVVPGNTHFDTTRANIEFTGAQALDMPIPEAREMGSEHPFKGNIDLDRLRETLGRYGAARIPFVLITITNNSGGGQPVSLANVRAARELCLAAGVPLLIDAARFAENAWFIKQREPGQAERSPREIARELFSLSDGAMMSMKKDAFGNIGGVLTLNDEELAGRVRNLLILTEGFPTYGGLAGRDLDALAIGLEEILDPDYLEYRIKSTAYVGWHLDAAGVPLLKPFGGHAIYLDGRRFCEHLRNEQLPGWALSVALYVHAGVRACEIGNVMFGHPHDPDPALRWPAMDLVRLAIPRRVYTQSHMDFVIEGITELHAMRKQISGLRFVTRPAVLPHFTAEFEPIS
ncbi:MAG: tryptophanase [Calditrichaeota bacterium]|nr:tryptophanase [Candidatus Cloacimonadota bacterium]MCB1046710.1 tryptophanase [Calditrichota bacterium]